jgi:[acyl-carrier-protein] S-malonyltransferase
VQRAVDLAKQKGAKMAVLIPVSVPSHCELMRPAADRLALLLSEITLKPTMIPVINNADVNTYNDAASIRDGLVKQLYMPVRWVETIKKIMQMNITTIIECGPGKVLTGLNKRIDKTLSLQSICDLASIENILNVSNERNAT